MFATRELVQGQIPAESKTALSMIDENHIDTEEERYSVNNKSTPRIAADSAPKKDVPQDTKWVRELTAKQIERDLKILGVTAMEDLLQDSVKECISDFRDAGIKVWMLTGDKGDTAHQIAYSCGLYSHELDFKVFKIDDAQTGFKQSLKELDEKIDSELDRMIAETSRFGLTISATKLISLT
jgi:magnesium-transporting ATPase (P-type)